MTITDDAPVTAMHQLAGKDTSDLPVVAGESGAAGLAGLAVLRANAAVSEEAGLDATSRVLVINTEGATAPSVYQQLVGESHDSVLARQAAWLAC